MAKAISMPNPLFAWSYWFLLWDRRRFWGLRLSWQKTYLMQKKFITWAKSWDLIMFFWGQYLAFIEPQIDLPILVTHSVNSENIKFRFLKKASNIWKKYPTWFDVSEKSSKQVGDFSDFVSFSQYFNFTYIL